MNTTQNTAKVFLSRRRAKGILVLNKPANVKIETSEDLTGFRCSVTEREKCWVVDLANRRAGGIYIISYDKSGVWKPRKEQESELQKALGEMPKLMESATTTNGGGWGSDLYILTPNQMDKLEAFEAQKAHEANKRARCEKARQLCGVIVQKARGQPYYYDIHTSENEKDFEAGRVVEPVIRTARVQGISHDQVRELLKEYLWPEWLKEEVLTALDPCGV